MFWICRPVKWLPGDRLRCRMGGYSQGHQRPAREGKTREDRNHQAALRLGMSRRQPLPQERQAVPRCDSRWAALGRCVGPACPWEKRYHPWRPLQSAQHEDSVVGRSQTRPQSQPNVSRPQNRAKTPVPIIQSASVEPCSCSSAARQKSVALWAVSRPTGFRHIPGQNAVRMKPLGPMRQRVTNRHGNTRFREADSVLARSSSGSTLGARSNTTPTLTTPGTSNGGGSTPHILKNTPDQFFTPVFAELLQQRRSPARPRIQTQGNSWH